MRPLPDDPNELVVNWAYHDWQVLVWEDPNEVFPWCLRWWTSEVTGWFHEETFPYVTTALVRAGVIAHVIETDARLVQPNLGVPSDRAAFDELLVKLLGFTTARRESTAPLHAVRR